MNGKLNGRLSPGMIAAVILGALILCWPAYVNGFPLVFGDTGNYIGQAILHYIGWNAPPFYSMFLLATDWRVTLWTPILAQGLIVASLLSMVLHQFDLRGPRPTIFACVGLAVFTSLPWVVAELMADMWTGVVVLSLCLLGLGVLGRWQRIYLLLLTTGAIAVHQSHLPLSFGLVIVGCMVRWGQDGRRAAALAVRRLAPAPILAAILVFAVNFIVLGLPSISPFGGIVLAARMIGDGTGLEYLNVSCPTQHYKICAYRDQLAPGGYRMLWTKPALWAALGGRKAWAPEADRIVRGAIANDPEGFMTAALENGFREFIAIETGERLESWPGAEGPRPMIDRFYHHELAAYDHSLQETGRLVAFVKPFATLHVVVAWFGLAGLLVLLVIERRDRLRFGFCVMVLAAVVGNALITGALSGVESRYAARIAWLMAFIPSVVFAQRFVRRARSDTAEVVGASKSMIFEG